MNDQGGDVPQSVNFVEIPRVNGDGHVPKERERAGRASGSRPMRRRCARADQRAWKKDGYKPNC